MYKDPPLASPNYIEQAKAHARMQPIIVISITIYTIRKIRGKGVIGVGGEWDRERLNKTTSDDNHDVNYHRK